MPPTTGKFEIYNDTTEDIPGGGLCFGRGGYTERGELRVVKPTLDSQRFLIVADETGVRAQSGGLGSVAPSHLIVYDATKGVPVQGDDIGSVAGSWFASKKRKGFKVYGGAKFGWCSVLRADDLASDAADPEGAPCSGPGWMEALSSGMCVSVRLISAEGACACAATTAGAAHLCTLDGQLWQSVC